MNCLITVFYLIQRENSFWKVFGACLSLLGNISEEMIFTLEQSLAWVIEGVAFVVLTRELLSVFIGLGLGNLSFLLASIKAII
jgi:hypothetical protein